MAASFHEERMYTFIKDYAMGLNWTDTPQALSLARKAHKDQRRKSGEPYIIHPLTVASHAIALGIKEDAVVAAAILHDVVEDCNVHMAEIPGSEETRYAVHLLTHIKSTPLEQYYHDIATNRVATLVKLLDRCDNVSTMAGVFSVEKIQSYIQETRDYVLPLYRIAKDQWPEDSNALFVLKYHIMSVIDGLEACLKAAA